MPSRAGATNARSATLDKGNCWEPSIAIDSKDTVYVGYDCYGKGGYNVYVQKLEETTGSPLFALESLNFEAYITLAIDKQDRLWMAWHESGVNWGKDWGYPFDITANATGLYNSREIRIAVLDGRLKQPAQRLQDALPPPGPANNFYEYPQLAADGSGRMWCFFRHRRAAQHNVYWRTPSHHALWEIYGSYYEGGKWSPMMLIPYSTGRTDMRIVPARAPSGELVAAWPTDRRSFRDFVNEMGDVFVGRIPSILGAAQGFRAGRLRRIAGGAGAAAA